jgi:hypothetical protein
MMSKKLKEIRRKLERLQLAYNLDDVEEIVAT